MIASSQMLTTRRRAAAGAALVLAASALGAAVDRSEDAASRITVYAASSLTDVFPKIDRRPRYSFASSSTLAQQIRQGAPADVFASADLRNPQELRSAGLCGRPLVFATNALVVVYPRTNPGSLKTVFDLRRPGLKVVIAEAGVPIGDYTRTVLGKLGISRAVLANVVSQEPDVRGVLAKVALGEADAGFVYRTDAATVGKRVGVIRLPARAQPSVKYGICVVSASRNAALTRVFVDRVLGRAGRVRLTAAGFGVPAVDK
jgi:molybdate transport system substrate-binding protein